MSLSHTVFEINGDFRRKFQIFPPRVFNAPAEGVPLGIGIGSRSKKTRMLGLPEGRKSSKIGLTV